MNKLKIHKDDIVEVIAGKDKGKRGSIVRVFKQKRCVIVSDINIIKKTLKRQNKQDSGRIADIEASLHISNVAIVCKKCGHTRVKYKISGGLKSRVCRKCGDIV
ncbi:50S ribosomal protein L24 [Treponema endosymbiont of Eucomonympha sp.]|uniref:50S ribosomal protein L24 n=1 Tax=Treponema endosymbiont of Eucomonympha sp. TaxID=1580831 RepID=UPI000B0D9968|nr:50S ribosomal protein L24 [Treponema endosymbiont of Eucomonympha sp.]